MGGKLQGKRLCWFCFLRFWGCFGRFDMLLVLGSPWMVAWGSLLSSERPVGGVHREHPGSTSQSVQGDRAAVGRDCSAKEVLRQQNLQALRVFEHAFAPQTMTALLFKSTPQKRTLSYMQHPVVLSNWCFQASSKR